MSYRCDVQPPFACSFMCCKEVKEINAPASEERLPKPNAPGLKDILATPWPWQGAFITEDAPPMSYPRDREVEPLYLDASINSRASVEAEEDVGLGSDSSSGEEDGAVGACTFQNRSSHVLEVLLWKEPQNHRSMPRSVGAPRFYAPMLREARTISAGEEAYISIRGPHLMACAFRDGSDSYVVFKRKSVCRVGSVHAFTNSHFNRAVLSGCAHTAKTLPQALSMYDGNLKQGALTAGGAS